MNAEDSNPNARGFLYRATYPDTEEWRARRRRRTDTLIEVCWGVIVLKTFLVIWVVHHYAMPFNPMWVVAPTVTFAFLATALYYGMRD